MRAIAILIPLLIAARPTIAQQTPERGYVPPHGFVPDSATAVRIAVAVWIPIYGAQQIRTEEPFKASLKDSVWTVTGTLSKGQLGGTAVAKIGQRDGRILFVTHYR